MNYNTINMTNVSSMDTIGSSITGALTGVTLFISLALILFSFICCWKLFSKAGEPGWFCLIPIYSMYIMFKLSFGKGWYFFLMLILIVNIVIAIMQPFKLAKFFGQKASFGLGLLFLSLIFYPILAFGSSKYIGQE